jgi:putative redox protein
MSSPTVHAPIVVTHDSGVRFTATIREHRIIVDQPVRGGGEDAGPSPIELLGASLGTCIALYVQQFCAARNLPHDGLRVEVVQHGAANPNRVGKFAARVILADELPQQYMAMLERVAQSCPAHNTLVHGAAVDVVIETTVPIVSRLQKIGDCNTHRETHFDPAGRSGHHDQLESRHTGQNDAIDSERR